MTIDPQKLYRHHKRHLENLKTQIARCLDKEMSLKLEERRDRARQLGIDWMIAQQQQKLRRSSSSAT
jgi:hypothetical protein